MREPPDLRDLVGEDLPPEEFERLRRVDALLRRVPAPPTEVPATLTTSVVDLGRGRENPWTRRRVGIGLALAAAVSALAFGVGRWTSGNGFEDRYTVAMRPGAAAGDVSALIRVGERDAATGNWQLELNVAGLPRLPAGEYYVLWLAKDGRYAATCGSFSVGEGETTVRMTVSYRLRDYDTWVITRHRAEGEAPWLLQAPIRA